VAGAAKESGVEVAEIRRKVREGGGVEETHSAQGCSHARGGASARNESALGLYRNATKR